MPTALPYGDEPGLRRAVTALSRLLAVLGTGRQHIVCSLGVPRVAAAQVEVVPFGTGMILHHAPARTWELAALLAQAFSDPCGPDGGLIVRTSATSDTPQRVRGWRVHDGWLAPLTAAEVFSAYCTDPLTGDPLSPESNVDYCPGLSIPTPEEIR